MNHSEMLPRYDAVWYGNADILAQIADELRNNPHGCMAVNLLAWYNAVYTALSESADCSYQVKINTKLCSTKTPTSVTDSVDIVSAYVLPMDGRTARVVIQVMTRELLRRNTQLLGGGR